MYRINYNQLFYFYMVATEGSIKSACAKLNLTQPTLSGQIKTFENNLGVNLFDRKHRRLNLNENGKAILTKAEKIFGLGDEIANFLSSKSKLHAIQIKLGVVVSLPNAAIHHFLRNHWHDGAVRVEIEHGSLDQMFEALDNGKVDLILSDTPYRPSRKYKVLNLGKQDLVAVGSSGLRKLQERFPKSLDGQAYLSFGESSHLQEQIDFFFLVHNIRPDRIGSIDSADLITQVVESENAFSILPRASVQAALAAGRLCLLGEMEEVISNYCVITSSQVSAESSIQKLINGLVDQKLKSA